MFNRYQKLINQLFVFVYYNKVCFFIKLLGTRWNCLAWLNIFALMLTKEVIWNEHSVQWPALPDSLPWSPAMLFPVLLPFWNEDCIKVKRFIGIIFQVNLKWKPSITLYLTLSKLNLKFSWTNNLCSNMIWTSLSI